MATKRASRVLLAGWGTAEWALLSPLLDRGELPNLGRLIREGALGRPATPQPSAPLSLWTTIATGVHPDRHGILGAGALDQRRHAAVWDSVAANGLRTHVVGWPGAVTAEPLPGVFVTPGFGNGPEAKTVSPVEFLDELADLHLHGSGFPAAALRELVPLAHQVDQRYDDRLARIANAMAMACSLHNAATCLLAEDNWAFAAVHYDAVAYCSAHFSEFLPPRMGHVKPGDQEIYGDLVAAVYRFHDLLLGTLMELAGPQAAVILVAPYGCAAGADRPSKNSTAFTDPMAWMTATGLVCVRGPGVGADELIYGSRLVDIAPTVLDLLGLDWGKLDGQSLVTGQARKMVSTEEAGLAAQFRAMVETDDPGTEEQERFQLAGVYMSTGRPHLALPLLEALAAEAPEEIRYQRTLAQCCIVLGRVEQAEALLEALIAGHEPHGWAYYLRGVIHSHRRQTAQAIADLEKASELGEKSSALHAFLGNVYLSKNMRENAEAAFRKAVELEPNSPDALAGLAAGELLRRRPERAAELALEAIALRYETPAAHLQLGIALARLGQWARAAVALRAAVTLAPGVKSAARYLQVVNARLLPHERR